MANRKAAVARTDDEIVDRRPRIEDLYRRVLSVVCLGEIRRSPRFVYRGLRDLHDPQAAVEEAEMAALAEQLAEQRLADGTPIECWSYDLPKGLPAPLDQLGHDPSPRRLTIYPDDRVDASKWFGGVRQTYERAARFSPRCDHSYFQAAFALAREYGV